MTAIDIVLPSPRTWLEEIHAMNIATMHIAWMTRPAKYVRSTKSIPVVEKESVMQSPCLHIQTRPETIDLQFDVDDVRPYRVDKCVNSHCDAYYDEATQEWHDNRVHYK